MKFLTFLIVLMSLTLPAWAEPSAARAVARVKALYPLAGPRLTGLFVNSDFVLALADAKGFSTTLVWKPTASDAAAFKRMNEILRPDSLRLQPDDDYQLNGTVNLINMKALDNTTRRRAFPGMVPYDWHTGWDGFLAWQKRLTASLKAAQKQGKLPADWTIGPLVYGIEYGYPDIAVRDFEEIKVAGRNLEHLDRLAVPDSDFYRNATYFLISDTHASDAEIQGTVKRWGALLHDFYRDPWNRKLATNVTFLKAQNLLEFDRPADRPTSLFLDTWGFESVLEQFEVTLQRNRPMNRPAEGGKAAASLWASLLPAAGPRLAAVLAQPEAVLTLAGARARIGWLIVPFPTADDLRRLDAINAVLVPQGMSIETSAFFLEDGEVKITNLGALERITQQSKVPGSVSYHMTEGWLGYFTWQTSLFPEALGKAQTSGLLPGDVNVGELEEDIFGGDPEVVETAQVPRSERKALVVEATLPYGFAPPSVSAPRENAPDIRIRLTELSSILTDFYADPNFRKGAAQAGLTSYLTDVQTYQRSLLKLTRVNILQP